MKTLYGIFFDLDGTLVDDEHLKAIAFSKAIEQMGGRSDPDYYKDVMGMSGMVIRNHFIAQAKTSIDPDKYMDLFKSIYMDLLHTDLMIQSGVISFLRMLKNKEFKMAAVSSAYSVSVNFIVNSLNLKQYFDLIISGDDVEQKKPNPECYLLALQKLSLSDEQAIVFEDTESGLKAASSAGIPCICIRHAYNESHDFSTAIAEYRSYEEDIQEIMQCINSIFTVTIL